MKSLENSNGTPINDPEKAKKIIEDNRRKLMMGSKRNEAKNETKKEIPVSDSRLADEIIKRNIEQLRRGKGREKMPFTEEQLKEIENILHNLEAKIIEREGQKKQN